MSYWWKLKHLLPFVRRSKEQDMHEELASFREMAGPGELGNLTLVAENARGVWTWAGLERVGRDLSYAGRTMRSNPTFAALAVLSLALGIGANTAVYSFIESIAFRKLPVTAPDSLVIMKWRSARGYYTSTASAGFSFSTGGTQFLDGGGVIGSTFPYSALGLFQDSTDVLASAFSYFQDEALNITVGDRSEVVTGHMVSGDYFHGIGLSQAAGRLLLPDDDRDRAAVAVLSHRFSTRHFESVAQAVGSSVRINNRPFRVVGVVPQPFYGAEPGSAPDVYVPLNTEGLLREDMAARRGNPNFYFMEIMGRLAEGVPLETATAALEVRFRNFVANTATRESQLSNLPELVLMDGSRGLDSLRLNYSRASYALMAMSGLILLIACANIANLLLARALSRRREIAVRLSLGAGRLQVVRQLLTESVLLSMAGGLGGVVFAFQGIRALNLLMAGADDNLVLRAGLNANVLVFLFVLSLSTGLLFGVVPALRATRVDVAPALGGIRTAVGHQVSGSRFGQALVVAQIILSLVLLVGAGLFARTLTNWRSLELGFNRDNVLLLTVDTRGAGYDDRKRTELFTRIEERFRQIPGIKAVGVSTAPLPTGGDGSVPTRIRDAALPSDTAGDRSRVESLVTVGPSYFETMQIPILQGREFGREDVANSPSVAVINKSLADALGFQSVEGRRILLGEGNNTAEYEVVGVVGNALLDDLGDEFRPIVYRPYAQIGPADGMTVQLRTTGDPLSYTNIVRNTVAEVDPNAAVGGLKTLDAHIDRAISREITLARLSVIFAGLALVTACVGLYATVAFQVTQRTNEIGVRVALGATRRDVIWLTSRRVFVLTAVGMAIGVPIALAVARLTRSFLFGIEPSDISTVALALAALVFSTLVAVYLPTRRASLIDPMEALRHE
jgi:macrolide transport system ATP-binding/permease protein